LKISTPLDQKITEKVPNRAYFDEFRGGMTLGIFPRHIARYSGDYFVVNGRGPNPELPVSMSMLETRFKR